MGLFKKDINELRWGVTEGGHVAHLIDSDKTDEKPIDGSEVYDYKKVSQTEAYGNVGDDSTRVFFTELAKKAAKDYDDPDCDKGMKTVLEGVRDYLTSSSRRSRQESIASLRIKMVNYKDALDKRIAKAKRENKDTSLDEKRLASLDSYADMLQRQYVGDLKVPSGAENTDNYIKANNPADDSLGKIGRWVKTDDELFPHAPSPNDVKQGAINDCYVMSSLIGLANTDPKKIRDAIRDNNDGTVTVRFFDIDAATNKKTPVYINVEKSVNKVGGANVYSSSSTWVQLVEKAYTVFMNAKNLNNKGYANVDRGHVPDFLNAFVEDAHYTQYPPCFGYNNTNWDPKYNANPTTINTNEPYTHRDTALFDFFKKRVEAKDIVTVGTNPMNDPEKTNYLLGIGIRTGHAYAVTKVFEADVNGVTKKFIQLRDPFATFRAKYDENGKLVNDSTFVKSTLNAGNSNMGTFNLEITDFQRTFNSFLNLSKEDYDSFMEISKQLNKEDADARKEAEEKRKAGLEAEKAENEEMKENENDVSLDANDDGFIDEFEDLGEENNAKENDVDGFEDLGDEINKNAKENDGFEDLGAEAADDYGFVDGDKVLAEKEKTDDRRYSVSFGFAKQTASLYEAKRRLFGVIEHDSAEMKLVKEKLEKLGEKNGKGVDEVKKAVEELKKAADAYKDSTKKAHNKRWEAVKNIASLADKELKAIEKFKSVKAEKTEKAAGEKISPEDEAERLAGKLTEKGIEVPEGFTEKITEMRKQADEAQLLNGELKNESKPIDREALSKIAAFDKISKSIENGTFDKNEYDKLVSLNAVDDQQKRTEKQPEYENEGKVIEKIK